MSHHTFLNTSTRGRESGVVYQNLSVRSVSDSGTADGGDRIKMRIFLLFNGVHLDGREDGGAERRRPIDTPPTAVAAWLMNDLTVSARRKSYFAQGVRTLNLYLCVCASLCFLGHKSKCVLRRRPPPPPPLGLFALHLRRRRAAAG